MHTDVGDDRPSSETMLQLITGFWVSQLVGVVAELGIADQLVDGPQTAAQVALGTETDERATFRLLRASAWVGLVTHDEGDRFSLTPLGATLRADVPGTLRSMAIAQSAHGHWLPWGHLRDAVRTGTRQAPAVLGAEIFDYYEKNRNEGRAFTRAMAELSALFAPDLPVLVDFASVATVIDVGGADGAFLASLLRDHPALRGVLFDRPHAVGEARAQLEAAGLASRCEVIAGDFFEGVPGGGDVYLLKQVLHDWDDERAAKILRNCVGAMQPRGRVLIVEMVIPDDPRPVPASLIDLNMLVMLPGLERSAREYGELLSRSGLRSWRVIESASPFQIIEARP
jgi:hypothetical protein